MRRIVALTALIGAFASVAAAQTLVTHKLGPGTATFTQAFPQGMLPAGAGVQVGDRPTQTNVTTTWPDGSARLAIVHTQIATAGAYQLRKGQAATGSAKPASWPESSVTFHILNADASRTVCVATTPTTPPAEDWFAGPIVHEGRVLVTPMCEGATPTPHPTLRVRVDIRTAGGGTRFFFQPENILDVPEMNLVTYDVDFAVAGAETVRKTAIAHHSFARWFQIVRTGGYQESAVDLDFALHYAAKALVPPLVEGAANQVYTTATAKFEPMQIGDLMYPMAAPGGRPEVGPYPAWYFSYLAHKTASQLDYVLKNGGNVSGAWSMHISWPDDRPVTLDNVIKPTANEWTWGNGYGPKSRAGRKWAPEIGMAHQPSLAVLPYYITGDRWYLDEQRHWSHYVFMGWGPFGRRAKDGIIVYQQTRGTAWALRDLADFLSMAPDTDPDRPYFTAKLKNNLRELDVRAKEYSADPLGSLMPTNAYVPTSTIRSQVPTWQNDYLTWSVHRLLTLGFGPESTLMRDRLVQWRLKMFTTPGFNPVDASEYWFYVVRHEDGTPFKDFVELWNYNFKDPDPKTGKPRKVANTDLLPGYAIDVRLAVMVAKDLGLEGAETAYKFVMDSKFTPSSGIPKGWGILDELKRRTEFALAPPAPAVAVPPTVEEELIEARKQIITLQEQLRVSDQTIATLESQVRAIEEAVASLKVSLESSEQRARSAVQRAADVEAVLERIRAVLATEQ